MIEAAENIIEVVGNTPLVRCNKLASHVKSNIFLKLEYLNPGGSVKDRPALQMILDAEASGELLPGGTIVEATSGNTGMGLAMAAAVKGYKCIFVMPDKMSDEKIRGLRACGAKVVVCPTAVEPEDERSYYRVSERLAQETPGGFLGNQYHNPSNPKGHYLSTGPELWEQTNGEIDVFVSSIGTGGTISGTGKYLKEQNPDVVLLGVDPVGSIYYDYFKTGKITQASTYLVEGFGEDFLPSTMDFDYVDEVVRVTDGECFHFCRDLVRREGIFAGGSSGGALAGAIKYAERFPDKELNIVVIMCDSYARYLSKIFDDEWMKESGFLDEAPQTFSVADVLASKGPEIHAARLGDTVASAVGIMKQYGISQLPVLDGKRVAGIINETDVLNHLLDKGNQSDKIDALIDTQFAIVEPSNRLSLIGQFFKQNKIVLVVDGDDLTGIVTKIDYIDFVSSKL